MALTAVFSYGLPLNPPKLTPKSSNLTTLKHISTPSVYVPHRLLFSENATAINSLSHSFRFRSSTLRLRSFAGENPGNPEAANKQDKVTANELLRSESEGDTSLGTSFLAKMVVALGVAATITAISVVFKGASLGSLLGVQGSVMAATPVGFSFKAFGYTFVLPEQPPGWVYFWLLMAAGCGLFISEEALNVWVGITLARMLSLDGTRQSLVESFSSNSPYIISTVLWVYWGVCISDMIPFYLGKLFRQSGATGDVCAKLGIGEEKVLNITRLVQKYRNLSGVVERFSLGVRNPTAFLAGALNLDTDFGKSSERAGYNSASKATILAGSWKMILRLHNQRSMRLVGDQGGKSTKHHASKSIPEFSPKILPETLLELE